MSVGREAKSFMTIKVLGRAGADIDSGREGEHGCSLDHALFEGNGAQRDVNPDPGRCAEQDYAIAPGEGCCVLDSAFVGREKCVCEVALVAEACQQSEIKVAGHARLAPSLHGDSADEARAPAVAVAEILKRSRRVEKIDHLRSFANQACISTIPEDGRGGRVRVA